MSELAAASDKPLVLRLPDDKRSPQDLARTLIDTPAGQIPVSAIATVQETDGPNQIGRENGRRRIVVYANTDGSDMGRVIGKQGRIAKAIRVVMRAASVRVGEKVLVEID